MPHNTVISICKALAIILMVIGHADCPDALGAFLYEFHMPLFFITAGYFFSVRYINDEATFVKNASKDYIFLLSHGRYSSLSSTTRCLTSVFSMSNTATGPVE